MSSLSKAKNGSWRLQVKCPDGVRRDVYFSCNKKTATTLKNKIDEMVQCKKLHEPFDVKTQHWLTGQDESILRKLEKLQLIDITQESRGRKTLSGWCDAYIGDYGHKSQSKRKLSNVAEKLIQFFGRDRLLQDITAGDAKRFYVALCSPKSDGGYGLKANSTAARHVGYCRQFFEAAINEEIILSNPFKTNSLSAQVKTDKSRHFYIDSDLSYRLLLAMPNLVWRLRWTLIRYQGLRVPSEMNELRWNDIDWAGERILIRSPKTAHISGKESRHPAIMPEVMPYLEEHFARAPDGSDFVLPRMANKNYRKFFIKYLEVEGIRPWPALFVNARRSAATDAHNFFPPHVCYEWFGHSKDVFLHHYGQVTEEHFKLARQRPSAIPQLTPQQASESSEQAGNQKKKDSEQIAQSPFQMEGYGRDQKSEEIDDSSKWAIDAHTHHFTRGVIRTSA